MTPDQEPSPEAAPWTVARILRWAATDLNKRGCDAPRLDAELLLGRTLGLSRVELIVHAERPLTETELAEFKRLFVRRRTAEPMAYILGQREFYGHEFSVDRRVLIPRPDSETLVEVGLDRTRHKDMYGRALDLCTGSGCIALAFGLKRRTWKVTATDVSAEALMVARDNALKLGAAHSVHFVEGDLWQPVAGQRFDLILANPPYIPSTEVLELMNDVRDFEPHLALDGGTDGLSLLERLVAEAPNHLLPGGVLACEVGAGQSTQVSALFERAGFSAIQRTRDYGGHERVVSGRV